MINLSLADPEHNLRPRLTVMGVGGAGGNAINNMIRSNLEGCDFIAANTDSQALAMSLAPRKIQLGINMSRGLGAGSKPDTGRAAAEEQLIDIMACLEGSDMLFVTSGMGGGTGTGAAPVIARAARESGILTVGVVTKPFHFEGNNRMRQAEIGIAELQQYVDTLIVIPNQNLFRIANERTTFAEAFRLADEVLHCGVRGITDLMVMPGFMNLDFADVKTVMGEMGKAMMGTGEAEGEERAIRAAEAAISNPLLDDVSMKGARGVLINITGGMDMTLFEVDQAANRIREEVDPEAQIKVGSTLGEDLMGRIRVSVIATGIDASVTNASRSSGGGISPQQQQQRIAAQRVAAITAVQQQVQQMAQTHAAQRLQSQALPAPGQDMAQDAPAHTAAGQPSVMTPSLDAQTSYFSMPKAITPQNAADHPMPTALEAASAAASAQAVAQAVREQNAAYAEAQNRLRASMPPAAQPASATPSAQTAQPAPSAMSAAQPARQGPPHFGQMTAAAQAQAQAQTQTKQARTETAPRETPAATPDLRMTQLMTGAPAAPQSTTQQPAQPAAGQAAAPTAAQPATPPAAQQQADQRRIRRSESLFTRITGFGLIRPSAQREEEEDALSSEESAPEATSTAEAQPKLGINPSDRPVLSGETSSDLLEIPAFLRRQTNH
jgi:cell division protein FtsZ